MKCPHCNTILTYAKKHQWICPNIKCQLYPRRFIGFYIIIREDRGL